MVETYGLQEAFAGFQEKFATWGAWIICLKGLTPIPYKLVTIASGVAHFDLPTFILASIVARGGRFFVTAALLRRFGLPIR
ncbi:DedA family protein, partial [Acinetobacter baumannii]